LSVLHGYTEAMSEGKLEGSQEIYQIMHQQAKHLNYLIEDLRTLTLLDSNELNLQIQNIDPGLVLQQIITAFSSLTDEKGIELSLNPVSALPRVELDPDRLNQIIGNLLNNAITILDDGGEIQLSAIAEQDLFRIKVWDNGPGIKDEDIQYIFDRFYKIDDSRSSADGSSGLGLAIAKKLVEAMRGQITVESNSENGTTFTVDFPID